jgi:phage replication-related protein YjqB (UPF0714/DUF867 family)
VTDGVSAAIEKVENGDHHTTSKRFAGSTAASAAAAAAAAAVAAGGDVDAEKTAEEVAGRDGAKSTANRPP